MEAKNYTSNFLKFKWIFHLLFFLGMCCCIFLKCGFAADVLWTNLENVAATGNDLTKNSGSNGWNGGAESFTIFSSDGFVDFEATETNRYRMCGLSSRNIDSHYNTIEYAIYTAGNGRYYVYENGRRRNGGDSGGSWGTYVTGDRFQVDRTGSVITYKKNSTIFYTSTVASTSETGLLVDCSIYTNNGTITDAQLNFTSGVPGKITNIIPEVGNTEVYLDWDSPANNGAAITNYEIRYGPVGGVYGAPFLTGSTASNYTVPSLTNGVEYKFQVRALNGLGTCPDYSDDVIMTPNVFFDATWVNSSANTTVTGNSIAKSSGINSWDGGAETFTSFSGDGAVVFKATHTNRHRMCGLSSRNLSNHYNTMEYAIYLAGNSRYYIYENGRRRNGGAAGGSWGTYIIGDSLSVERSGTAILYKRNGTTFYTSAISVLSDTGLRGDCSIYNIPGAINDAKIVGVTPGPPSKITNIIPEVGNNEVFLDWDAPANNASAITDYEIRYGPVGGAYGAPVLAGSSDSNFRVTGLTNGVKYKFQVRAVNGLGTCPDYSDEVTMTPNLFFDVTWINPSSNATVTGNTISKSSGGNGWDAGAESFTSFSGDGAVVFKATHTNRHRMCGLSSRNLSDHYNTMEYAMYLAGNGRYYVYENGRRINGSAGGGSWGAYIIGDSFSVERSGTSVVYKQNDTIFYTSTNSVLSETGLRADSSLYNVPGSIDDAKIVGVTPGPPSKITNIIPEVGDTEVLLDWDAPANNASAITDYEIRYAPVGEAYGTSFLTGSNISNYTVTGLTNGVKYKFQVRALNGLGTCPDYSDEVTMTPNIFIDVTWINPSTNVTVTGNTISKTSGGNGWDGGAESFTSFSGDGAVVFKATHTNRHRMCGLSSRNLSDHYRTIEYAIYVAGNRRYYVYENGRRRNGSAGGGSWGTYIIGDSFSVERSGTTIVYKRNDSVFYTSATPILSETGVRADCSLYNRPGSIDDTKIVGVRPGPPGKITLMNVRAEDKVIELTWAAPANNGSAITEYEVQYGPVYSGGFESTLTQSGTSISITGLQLGTEYQFRVLARNALGSGPLSDIVTATPASLVNISWTDLQNVTDFGGTNSVQKNVSGNGWNGGAASVQNFSGYGGIEFEATLTNRHRMCGLSRINADAHYRTIEYAMYLAGNGRYYVYENGRRRNGSAGGGSWGTYIIGDIFRVERRGSIINYKRNNSIFYTSAVPSSEILIADCSLYNQPGSINNAKMFTSTVITNFRAEASTAESTINLAWDNPTSVEDPNFAGAMVRYSTSGFPSSITDGNLLGTYNILTETAIHLNVLSETTYYYSIFAYDTAPTYESPVTTQVITNDLVSPDRVTSLTATRDVESIVLTWTNPDISVYPNQDLEGVMIRRSESGFPMTHEEGEQIVLLLSNENTYTDKNLDPNVTYYYSLFTYDEVPHYSDPEHVSAKPLQNIDKLVIVPASQNGNFSSIDPVTSISGEAVVLKIVALSSNNEPVLTLSESKNILISGMYESSSSNLAVTINGASIPSAFPLQFSAGMSQTFSYLYNDAGIISLHASSGSDTVSDTSDDYKTLNPLRINNVPKAFDMNIVSETNPINHQVVGKPFNLELRSVSSYRANSDYSSNPTTPSYFSSKINLLLEGGDSNYPLGSLSNSSLAILGGAGGTLQNSLVYNELGKIKIGATDYDYLGVTISGSTDELVFTPHSFQVSMVPPPENRGFYYINESISTTFSVLDFNQRILGNYKGEVLSIAPERLDINPSFTFTGETQGQITTHLSSAEEGFYDFHVQDANYDDIVGTSERFEIKYAEITINSESVYVNETAMIHIAIVDKNGKIITSDNTTSFYVKLNESIPNETAKCEATTKLVKVQSGQVSVPLTDNEEETVMVSVISYPSLESNNGTFIFTQQKEVKVGKGGIRIEFWGEEKE